MRRQIARAAAGVQAGGAAAAAAAAGSTPSLRVFVCVRVFSGFLLVVRGKQEEIGGTRTAFLCVLKIVEHLLTVFPTLARCDRDVAERDSLLRCAEFETRGIVDSHADTSLLGRSVSQPSEEFVFGRTGIDRTVKAQTDRQSAAFTQVKDIFCFIDFFRKTERL